MKSRRYLWRIAMLLLTFAVGVGVVRIFSVARTAEIQSSSIDAKNEPLQNEPRELLISDEGYAVFSALLSYLNPSEQIVVSDYAVDEHWERGPESRRFRGLVGEDLIYDYIAKNLAARKLENKFTVPGKIYLLSQAEEDALFPKNSGGWEKFRARFPKASDRIIYLSNVGFNHDETVALVYLARQCRTCNGTHYVLQKVEGKWIVQASTGNSNGIIVE